MGILKVDEVQAMKIVARRSPHDKIQQHFSDYLLGMDSGIELIDYHDKQQVQDEQKSVCYKLDGIENFRYELAQKRQDIRSQKKRLVHPNRVRLPKLYIQEEAKLYIPQETCSIWMSNTRHEWWGHCHPFKRVREAFKPEDEHQAVTSVIRQLWLQHCEVSGDFPEDFPFAGIVD